LKKTKLTMKLMIAAVLLLPALAAAFDIKSSKPSSGSVTVREGQSLDLRCNVDGWWEWCKFTHVPSNAICDLEWEKEVYNVTVLDCDAFDKRWRFVGAYGNNECGIKIDDIRPEEAGAWTCDVESYYAGYTRNYGYKAKRSFNVEVELKVTTTTTTTTTTASTTSAAYEYDEVYYDTDNAEEETATTEGSGESSEHQNGGGSRRKNDDGSPTIYIIIAVVGVLVVCLVIVFAALHYKRKLPPGCYTFSLVGGKSFKPVDQNETMPEGGDEASADESKHPTIVKNGSNGVSPSKEAKPLEINPELTTVTFTSEKEAAAEEKPEEERPLKEED
jgi:hypothetical protein